MIYMHIFQPGWTTTMPMLARVRILMKFKIEQVKMPQKAREGDANAWRSVLSI